MDWEAISNLLLNNGAMVVLLGYFIWKDYKCTAAIQSSLQTVAELTKSTKEVLDRLQLVVVGLNERLTTKKEGD